MRHYRNNGYPDRHFGGWGPIFLLICLALSLGTWLVRWIMDFFHL